MRFGTHGDAVMYFRMFVEERFNHRIILAPVGFERKVELNNLHSGEMVFHVMTETHFAIILLFARHFPIFGLLHQHDTFFLSGHKHQHLCGKVTTAERILTEEREGIQIGHVRVKQDEWNIAFV